MTHEWVRVNDGTRVDALLQALAAAGAQAGAHTARDHDSPCDEGMIHSQSTQTGAHMSTGTGTDTDAALGSGAEQRAAGHRAEQQLHASAADDRDSSRDSSSSDVRSRDSSESAGQSEAERERGKEGGSDAIQRTMVFANTVASVRAIGRLLRNRGIGCFEYHKEMTLDERAAAIGSFEERGGVLVCTDAGARGIDIRDVSHVIQVGVSHRATR